MIIRAFACAVAALIAAGQAAAQTAGRAPPFVTTPPEVVERMLTLAQTRREDLVMDLGSGDGRIVIAAAKKYGARGIGVDPEGLAERRAKFLGLDEGGDHRLDVVDPGSLAERAKRLGAWAACSHLQVHPEHLLVQGAVPALRLLGDPGHRRVEPHAGLDADHQQVEHVRQGVFDFALSSLDSIAEPEVRQEEADEQRRSEIGQRRVRGRRAVEAQEEEEAC